MNRSWRIALLLALVLVGTVRVAAASAPSPEEAAALSQYLQSVADTRWDDALPAAERLLALARARGGEESPEAAEALSRLGGIQIALRDYDNAEANFIAALAIREKKEGPLNKDLEDPLHGLGFVLAAKDRHAEAVPVLERALLISQRHNGLFDVSQRSLRQQLGVSLAEIGRGQDADHQFRTILQTAEKAYGPEDLRLVGTLNLVGDWSARRGDFVEARELYRRSIAIIEKQAGLLDARLILPLRDIGRTYLRELMFANAGIPVLGENGALARPLRRTRLPGEGLDALMRALSLMEADSQRQSTALRVGLVDVGDWHFLMGNESEALKFYRRALEQPFGSSSDGALVGDPLSYPGLLDYVLPPVARRYMDRPEERTQERSLVVEFTVTKAGTVVDPKIVEGDATERMERETLASIAKALYRPRFEGNEPVDTPNVRFTQIFRDLKN